MEKWITFLDSVTPFVQAFDVVLMLLAGIYCVASAVRRGNAGVIVLGISCFLSALILMGFFAYGITHGRGTFPELAYVAARLLAPFELLLFAIGIVLVARRNARKADQPIGPDTAGRAGQVPLSN